MKNSRSLKMTDLVEVYNVSEIANEYTQQPYNIGDYVTYQGMLYRCNTQILLGESWNESHWTAIKRALYFKIKD